MKLWLPNQESFSSDSLGSTHLLSKHYPSFYRQGMLKAALAMAQKRKISDDF
jgi:hypothetical protein